MVQLRLDVSIRQLRGYRKGRTLETQLAAPGSDRPDWSLSRHLVRAGVTQGRFTAVVTPAGPPSMTETDSRTLSRKKTLFLISPLQKPTGLEHGLRCC